MENINYFIGLSFQKKKEIMCQYIYIPRTGKALATVSQVVDKGLPPQ